jgi:hypothetical protein
MLLCVEQSALFDLRLFLSLHLFKEWNRNVVRTMSRLRTVVLQILLEVVVRICDARFQLRPSCCVVFRTLRAFRFELPCLLFELLHALFESGNATVLTACDHAQKSHGEHSDVFHKTTPARILSR